uniref:Uncharacterized protein n=1 Tax=Romanomermis culicivorax TaxID=13658 RepID=A0A915JU13_ROMCU
MRKRPKFVLTKFGGDIQIVVFALKLKNWHFTKYLGFSNVHRSAVVTVYLHIIDVIRKIFGIIRRCHDQPIQLNGSVFVGGGVQFEFDVFSTDVDDFRRFKKAQIQIFTKAEPQIRIFNLVNTSSNFYSNLKTGHQNLSFFARQLSGPVVTRKQFATTVSNYGSYSMKFLQKTTVTHLPGNIHRHSTFERRPVAGDFTVSNIERQFVPKEDQIFEKSQEKSFAGLSNYRFSYQINRDKDFCKNNSSTKIDNLIIVHSAAEHFEARSIIRKTWGQKAVLKNQYKSAVLFFVGQPVNEYIQNDIREESRIHKDLIQATFVDTYRNLTYKAVSWLRWINDYCNNNNDNNSTFVIKVDDDILLNMDNLFAFLNVRRSLNEKFTIYCRLWQNLTKIHIFHKVNLLEDTVTIALPSSGYILTGDLIRPIYDQSLKTKFFWIDDIYVTGLLIEDLKSKIKIKRYDLSGRYILSMGRLKRDKFLKSHAIFIHFPAQSNVRQALWYEIQNSKDEYREQVMKKYGDKNSIVKYADVAIKI